MNDLFSAFDEASFFQTIDDGLVHHDAQFLTRPAADDLFVTLRDNIAWKQESMNMYGKQVKFPRLTAWYGDTNRSYSFSGITLNPHQWTPELLNLRDSLNEVCGAEFNSLLLNLYRNEKDSISWHQDAEKELGRNPIIASVSLGSTRTFHLRRIDDHSKKIQFDLGHGSLLVRGALQHSWQRSVNKSSSM